MNENFWHERWQSDRIGFHNSNYHPLLLRHWQLINVTGGRVFVPLCGKSMDMVWLADRGHQVLGCDLSPIAIHDFYAERKLTPTVEVCGELERHSSGLYQLLVGDFFALSPSLAGGFGAIYDRAALIALPAAERIRYVRHLGSLASKGCQLLLITLEHQGTVDQGPPFCVAAQEVERLFADWSALACVDSASADLRGQTVTERCFILTR